MTPTTTTTMSSSSSLPLLLLLASFIGGSNGHQRLPYALSPHRKFRLINTSDKTLNLLTFPPDGSYHRLVQESIGPSRELTLDATIGIQFAIQDSDCHDSSCPLQYFIVSEYDVQKVTVSSSSSQTPNEASSESSLKIDFWDDGIEEGRLSHDPVVKCRANAKAELHALEHGSSEYLAANTKLMECDLPILTRQQTQASVEAIDSHACGVDEMKIQDDYWGDHLPYYTEERRRLAIEWIGAVVLLWATILSYVIRSNQSKNKPNFSDFEDETQTNKLSSNRKQKQPKRPKKNGKKAYKTDNAFVVTTSQHRISWLTVTATATGVLLATLGVSVFTLLFRSSNNFRTARAAFQAPLLTKGETQHMLEILQNVTARNYLKAWKKELQRDDFPLIWKPYGWQKLRHKGYPTTDLSLLTDPFVRDEQEWIANILNRRLAPTLARIYGIPPSSIRAHDLFFVRYDHDLQATLNPHEDNSMISFNLLLTEDFDDGGTKFYNRRSGKAFAHIQPETAGSVVIHRGQLRHEGVDVTRGVRIILVGFLKVDMENPFSNASHGLSWYASWLDFSWLGNYLLHLEEKELVKTWGKPTILSNFFRAMSTWIEPTLDLLTKHHFVSLGPHDTNSTSAYLRSLDCQYAQSETSDAMWFSGHNILHPQWPRLDYKL